MTDKKSEQIFVKAYDVAASYDMRSVRDIFVNNFTAKILNSNPVLAELSPLKMVSVFDYGSIIFFNVGETEIGHIMETLQGSLQRPNKRISEDEYILYLSSRQRKPEGTEELYVKELNRDIALLVGIVLSRSVSVEYYEAMVGDALAKIELTVEALAATGRTPRNARELTKQVGFAMSVEQELAYDVAVFDDPDIVWEGGAKIDALYKGLKREFDLEDRIKIIQHKVSLISRSSTFVISRLEAQRANILEWVIIILIAAEIIMALFKLM
jgi:required for meiotic nuclear division protein 1